MLCNTAPKIGTPQMWNERVSTRREYGMAHLGDTNLARWFAPSFAQQEPAAYRGSYNMLIRTSIEGYTGACEAIRDADMGAATGAIKAQPLVICGVEDLVTTSDAGRELADTMPNARFAEIEGAAHLPCIEQPEVMATAIRQFLKGNGYV